jgi:hypothetical protein
VAPAAALPLLLLARQPQAAAPQARHFAATLQTCYMTGDLLRWGMSVPMRLTLLAGPSDVCNIGCRSCHGSRSMSAAGQLTYWSSHIKTMATLHSSWRAEQVLAPVTSRPF